MRPAADAKGVWLTCLFDSTVGNVLGDPDRLQQVFWNLLSNAIKFTPEGGQVEVHLERVAKERETGNRGLTHHALSFAQVTVKDTGKGISAEFLPFVFDRFRQADSSMSRPDGGLGLGLAIVRHLIELHGGSVWAESPGLEQGATFTVRLPLLGNQSLQLPSENVNLKSSKEVNGLSHTENGDGVNTLSASSVQPLGNDPSDFLQNSNLLAGLRILLVGDEADSQDFLQAALEQFGATVAVAASAAEAFNLIISASEESVLPESWAPDVLVSDIAMPYEDGYSFIRRVRDLQAIRGTFVPALALTDSAKREDDEQALIEGFQMCLSKPIEPLSLVMAIANLTGRSIHRNFPDS
jgi:CheY-like chemotaxis protein